MKKKIVIIVSIILVITLIGVFGVRLCVNYVFDRYFLGTALSSVAENDGSEQQIEESTEKPDTQQTENTENEESGTQTQETAKPEEQKKKKLSNTEVISRVMRSSELTNKMAAMVPYEEKRAVLRIILSNFSENELAEIAKNASKGLSSAYKSQLIATAQARLTHAQWKQCLNIAYKYVDAIRPYVE